MENIFNILRATVYETIIRKTTGSGLCGLAHVQDENGYEIEENPSVRVVLKLENLPYNLLKEEHPFSEKDIEPNLDSDNDRFPWKLDTTVYDMRGIGRFYLGLAQKIRIEVGEELKKYAREYISGVSEILDGKSLS